MSDLTCDPPTPPRPGRRLTVVQTLPEMHSGGVEQGVLEVGRALVEAGHRSIVVSAGGRLVDRLIEEGSEHVAMPIGRKSPATFRMVKRLKDLLAQEGADVLHARSRVPAWVSLLAWRLMPEAQRPRFITTVHGLHSVSRYSSVMTRGETVIAVSNTVQEYIRQNYPACCPSRVRVIPRGVDPEVHAYGFLPDDKWIGEFFDSYPACRHKRLVMLPGRLTRLKGHRDFLRVIAETSDEVHGLIVGGEDRRRLAYAEELYAAVRTEGLADRVTFTGHRADIRELMAISDVVMSLSTKPESFGRTVLEALSLGRPVVGYDHGGVGEVLADLFPEGRVPLGDAGAAADAVCGLLESGNVPAPVEGYGVREMLDAILEVYSERPAAVPAVAA